MLPTTTKSVHWSHRGGDRDRILALNIHINHNQYKTRHDGFIKQFTARLGHCSIRILKNLYPLPPRVVTRSTQNTFFYVTVSSYGFRFADTFCDSMRATLHVSTSRDNINNRKNDMRKLEVEYYVTDIMYLCSQMSCIVFFYQRSSCTEIESISVNQPNQFIAHH